MGRDGRVGGRGRKMVEGGGKGWLDTVEGRTDDLEGVWSGISLCLVDGQGMDIVGC